MLSKREQLQNWGVPILSTGWLSAYADSALVGLVEAAAGDWVPVYDYTSLVTAVGIKEAGKFSESGGPWYIWPPDRPSFWQKVKDRQLVAWEHMTPAIIGLGFRLPQGEAVAYDRGLVMDLIIGLHKVDSRHISMDKRLQEAEQFFETKMLDADFPEHTPIYIWRLPK